MRSKTTTAAACLALFAVIALLTNDAGAAPPAPVAGDYYTIIAKTQEYLTGGAGIDLNDPDVQAKVDALHTLASDLSNRMESLSTPQGIPTQVSALPTATGSLWPEIVYQKGDFITPTYQKLLSMAQALQTPCAGRPVCHNNDTVLAGKIASALNTISINWYSSKFAQPASPWFNQEISWPSLIGSLLVLMYDQISWADKQKYIAAVKYNLQNIPGDHFNNYRDLEGANRSLEAFNFLLYGMVTHDNVRMAMARAGADSLCEYGTTNGFFPDGSYIEHRTSGNLGYSYTGGYGIGYYENLAVALHLFDGSLPWPNTNANLQNFTRFALDAFLPMIYRGAFHPLSESRTISRETGQDRYVAHDIMRAMVLGADFADPTNARYIKQAIKSSIQSDPSGYYSDVAVFDIPKSKALVADTSIVPFGDSNVMNSYSEMYKTVSNNPGYSFGISMFGPNHYNYESISGENLKGWHTADGMTYLYVGNDLTQFGSDFWPTVNPYRLPGTTVNSNATEASNLFNLDPWVGGMVSYDFHNGVTGMYLKPSDAATLEAKKSWIMFDGQIVALGTGISSTDGLKVETIVENRKLNASGNNAFSVNNVAQPTTLGWSQTLSNVSYMALQGNSAGSDIGYYFPIPVTLSASRTTRTGSWFDINSLLTSDKDPRTNNYLELFVDHGLNPANSSYAYVLLPNKSAAAVSAYASTNPIAVLRNDAHVQAAYDPVTTSVGANFWIDSSSGLSVALNGSNYITVNKRASVFVRNRLVGSTRYTEIGISDPTKLATSITVQLGIPAAAIVYKGADITAIPTLPTTAMTFTVNVAGSQGATHYIKFRQN